MGTDVAGREPSVNLSLDVEPPAAANRLVPSQNLNPDVLMMESAEDWY